MKKIYTIGREEGCDIVIPDTTDIISRLHATIRVEDNDKIFIIDQSLNGTYINGMKMSSNVEIPVTREDVVSFAHIYNLDWSLVPKAKSNLLKRCLIIFSGLLILSAGTYSVIRNYDRIKDFLGFGQSEPEIEYPISSSPTLNPLPNDDIVALPDSIVENDSVEVPAPKESKEKEVEKTVEQDTVKPEKPKEIHNPIY